MNYINDNIDDLFRKRLGNKEMELANPGISFTNPNNSAGWVSKSLKIIQLYKVVIAVVAIGTFGTICFLLSNRGVDKNKNNAPVIDPVTRKDSIVVAPNETPGAIDDKLIEEEHSLKSKDVNKENVIPDSKGLNTPQNVKKEVLNNQSNNEPEHTNRESKNIVSTEQTDSLNQLVLDSIPHKFVEDSALIDNEEQIDKQQKTDLQCTEPIPIINDSIKSNTEETRREKKKKKRQVKKLR
jgi:hypothetical protein